MTPLKLLIVEDNLASLELMAEVFTSLKAEVRPVSDSEKAAGMVNREKFDGYLSKPVNASLLGEELDRLLGKGGDPGIFENQNSGSHPIGKAQAARKS